MNQQTCRVMMKVLKNLQRKVGSTGFSIRNGVDGRIWEVGGEKLKDAAGVFREHRKARASRGVRGHAPPENFENLGLLECISRILRHEEGYSNRTQTSLILDSFYSTVHKNCKYFFLSSLSLLLRLKHFKKSSLCFLWRRHACNLFKSRELYVTSRARGNIHTHALCCFRTQNPRFREYARLLSNWAIDRRNRWPPGQNYWDFS